MDAPQPSDEEVGVRRRPLSPDVPDAAASPNLEAPPPAGEKGGSREGSGGTTGGSDAAGSKQHAATARTWNRIVRDTLQHQQKQQIQQEQQQFQAHFQPPASFAQAAAAAMRAEREYSGVVHFHMEDSEDESDEEDAQAHPQAERTKAAATAAAGTPRHTLPPMQRQRSHSLLSPQVILSPLELPAATAAVVVDRRPQAQW